MVPHRSTTPTRPSLTSLFEWEAVTLDDVAAIHLYTQENPIYGTLNAALRSENRDTVKPYWGYIKLLQTALFKLPKDKTK